MKISKTKHHGNVRWRVHYQLNGKPAKRLFARESEAKAFASQYNDAAGMLRELANLPKAAVADALAAIQIAEVSSFKLMDAALHYRQHRPRTGIITADATADFLEYFNKQTMATASRRDVVSVVEALGELHGEKPLATLTGEMLAEFVKGGRRGPVTQGNHITRLNRFFNWCIKKGMLNENPAKDAETDPKPPKDIAWHNHQQAARLLATAKAYHPALVPFVALGYFCGLRVGEITGGHDCIGVAWHNIFLDRPKPELEVPTGAGKTRQRRMVPIPPNAAQWLERGGDLYPIKNFRKRLNALRADAELAKLGRWEWAESIARHTFGSMHVAQHARPEWTKYIMGHEAKSAVFKRNYDGRVSPAEAETFWAISP